MNGRDDRGVSTVVATVPMVGIVVTVSASIGIAALDLEGTLTEPQEPRVFTDATVTLGPEHRTWSGWNDGETDPPRRPPVRDLGSVPGAHHPRAQGG